MHYYSIDSDDACHLGFLVLMGETEDEDAQHSHNGFWALKAQTDEDTQQTHPQHWRILNEWDGQEGLTWHKQADYLLLRNAHGDAIGRLQQQYLTLCGQHFVLSDLTGTL